MKTLNESQIQELYAFTRKHFVECYDVQTELVDHLANDIEEIWKSEPNKTFVQVRDLSFKKFGVFGFMEIVEQKSKQMSKKYWLLIWNTLKDFFRIPQILLTIVIMLIIYTLLTTLPQLWVFSVIIFGIITIMLIRAFSARKKMIKRYKQTQKKWMLEEHIFGFGNFIGLFNVIFQVLFFSNSLESYELLVSSILTISILVMYIAAFILPSKAQEILKKEYPEYKSVTIS